MTCIVGLVQNATVYIGGDSCAGAGVNGVFEVNVSRNEKVFPIGPEKRMVLGCSTSFRMIQLLQYQLEVPAFDKTRDVMKYMVCDFVPAVRRLFREAGFAHVEHNEERGGQFLVGFAGCLFSVGSDFHVHDSAHDMEAIGAGRAYALGAFHAMRAAPVDSKTCVLQALTTASAWCNVVLPPFHIWKVYSGDSAKKVYCG